MDQITQQFSPHEPVHKKSWIAIGSVAVGVALLLVVVLYGARAKRKSFDSAGQAGIKTIVTTGEEDKKIEDAKTNSTLHAQYLQSIGDDDGDGLSNKDEAAYGTNSSEVDSDGDGLPDFVEIVELKTNPRVVDSDADGITDWNE